VDLAVIQPTAPNKYQGFLLIGTEFPQAIISGPNRKYKRKRRLYEYKANQRGQDGTRTDKEPSSAIEIRQN